MASSKIIKDDLRYVLFSEIYFRLEDPKAKRKAFTLLEAAIKCLAKKGFDQVTLEMIAREAGVTRPLLKHYFADIDEICEFAIKYIRVLFQRLAIEAMTKQKRPSEMIAAYVDSCFYWVDNFQSHSRVWLAFLHRCAIDKGYQKLNSEAVRTGTERIAGLIQLGVKSGEFHSPNPVASAKALQVMITGALITYATELVENEAQFRQEIVGKCLGIANS